MLPRILGSVVLIIAWGLLGTVLFPVRTIVAGNLAGMQFANSDAQAIASETGMAYVNSLHLPTILLLVLLVVIWWKPIRNLIGSGTASWVLAGMVVGGGLLASPAYAYYDKSDYAEAYTILPNESAFWIPDIGANKDSQVQIQSGLLAVEQGGLEAIHRPAHPSTRIGFLLRLLCACWPTADR